MHFQSLVAATLLAASHAAHAQIMDCELGGQPVNPSHGGTTAGKTGLMRCVDRQTRELLREEELRDGRFVGVKRWYEKGQLKREHSVNDKGNRDGRSREWNAQGVLVREGHDDNGKPSWEGRFVVQDRGRAVPTGAHKTFDGSGRLRAEAIYDDKGRVTRERSWDEAGRVQRDDEVFEDGSRKAVGKPP